MKDMFNNPIIKRKLIWFPVTGKMDIGKVHDITKKYVIVLNENGYRKRKESKYCIMADATKFACKEIYPENFI